MARYAPDGTLLEVLGEGKEDEQQDHKGNVLGEEQAAGNGQGGRPPCQVRGQGRQGGVCRRGGIGEYDLDPL